MDFKPYKYQLAGIDWIKGKCRCCLFWEMGLGKSVATLTAVSEMLDDYEVERVLIVAPKKVAETTWTTEAAKWSHLKHLRVAKVMGTAKQREAALASDADVYVIGRDSFVWLYETAGNRWPFDMVVLDELTSFKSPSSQRFKAMRAVTAKCRRVVGLTGTPAPNGLPDLWAQMYCVDMGERLGKFVTRYRDRYFDKRIWNNIVIKMTPKLGAEAEIRAKLADICLTMQAADYIELPPLIRHVEMVEMAEAEVKRYKQFERDRVMDFKASGDVAVATSAAALMNKLSQFANGAVYDTEQTWHEVHRQKLDRLAEIVEAAASPVLVFYQYKHDLERVMAHLADYKPRAYDGERDLADWNAGKVRVLLAHPASTAYGLNMQQGGSYIVWFGTGWNLELYQQANARLHRQGQTKPVHVYELATRGTVDELAMSAIGKKQGQQQALMDGLKKLLHIYG